MDLFFSNCLPPTLPPVRPPCTSRVLAHTLGPAPLCPVRRAHGTSRVLSWAAGARTEGHFPQAGRGPRAPCLQAVAALSEQGAHCCRRLLRPWWCRASAWPAAPGHLGSEASTPLLLCRHPVAIHTHPHTLKASTPTTKDEVALHTNLGLPAGSRPCRPVPSTAPRLHPVSPAGSHSATVSGQVGTMETLCGV